MKNIFLLTVLFFAGFVSSSHAAGPARFPAESGPYSVQLAAFRDEAEAQALIDELAAHQGIEARIQEISVPGKGRWFRVLAGSFAARRDAEAYVQAKDLRVRFPELWIRPMDGVALNAPLVKAKASAKAEASAESTAEVTDLSVEAQSEAKAEAKAEAPAPKATKPVAKKKEPVESDAPVAPPPPEEHPWIHAHLGYGLELSNINQTGDWGSIEQKHLALHHLLLHLGTHKGVLPGGLSAELFVHFQPAKFAADTANTTSQSLNLFDFGVGLKYRGFLLSFEARQQPVGRFLTSTTMAWEKFFLMGPAAGYDLTLFRVNDSGGFFSHTHASLRAKIGLPVLNASSATLAVSGPTGYFINGQFNIAKGIGVWGLEAGAFLDFLYRSTSVVSAFTGSNATINQKMWNFAFGLTFGGSF